MTDVMRSGADVPTARNVMPITSSGTPRAYPNVAANHTIRYVIPAMYTTLSTNVAMKR